MPNAPHDGTHIVVLNQHGDNRGDEAAMRAMVNGLAGRVADARFTIVHQFADRDSQVELGHPTSYLRLRMPILEFARLGVYVVLLALGRHVPAVAGPEGRRILEAIDSGDLVVSAPGGPYFGDLYAGHELAHWLFVFVAHRRRKRLFLYAPSCGPFENRPLNLVRRRGFGWFDRICVREEISAGMLRALTPVEPVVTSDSALQESVPAADRSVWADDGERLLVVAVRDPGEAADAHDRAVVDAIDRVTERHPTAVVFLPQLHGSTHRDAPYLASLAERLRPGTKATVAPETLDSDAQRGLVAAADLVLAGRYHPAVFSIAAATPVLIIAYEHKAIGVARAAGIERWAIRLEDLDRDDLIQAMDALIDSSDEVRAQLRAAGPRLQATSRRTTDEALAVLTTDA